jgi:hypothetical protein
MPSLIDLRCHLLLIAAIKEREYLAYVVLPLCFGFYREIEEFNFTFFSLIIDTSLSCNNISNNDLFTFVSLSFEIRKTSCNRS